MWASVLLLGLVERSVYTALLTASELKAGSFTKDRFGEDSSTTCPCPRCAIRNRNTNRNPDIMALSLASASYAFASTSYVLPNPAQAVLNQVVAASIVGVDMREAKSSVAKTLAPLRAMGAKANRAAQFLVMAAPDASTSKVVGDFGFDPLSLGTADNYAFMREAEIKHGRLAMLAAVAWPLQEILHPIFVSLLYGDAGVDVKDVLFESNGASPSLLNGGLFQAEIFPALFAFTVGASLLEESDLNVRKELGCSWNEYPSSAANPQGRRCPGNFGFDPLNFYRPLDAAGRKDVQERELMNGRVAMLAVATYVGTEFALGEPIVRATPALFEPLIIAPWFRAVMDASFGMASMDGSINGIAY